MTSFQPGELVLVVYPFVELGQGKRRPALVLTDTGDDDVVLARVTTQGQQTRFDIQISDWKESGLNAPSIVRMHKLATINKKLVLRRLGVLSNTDREKMVAAFSEILSGW